jgi:2,3-bisphosphoglycerate-independent phosphoglycerate mutase
VIIRDGWGYREISRGNAVLAARTPNNDLYRARYPWTLLDCDGESVGLPNGYQGSSEVGHLNMGAGRIVTQELTRIDEALSSGKFFNGTTWKKLVNHWRKNRSQLHLFGLLQDEGVHAHQEHLFKITRRARMEYPDGPIILHPFLDGRDTPPRSCLEYLFKLNQVMEAVGRCTIGTVMGRYYSMDRSRNWQLTDMAYHCIVACEGGNAVDAETAVKKSYAEERTPNAEEMCDEYIRPHVIGIYGGVRDGDCILHTNYRQDRAIQLSMAFSDPGYPGNLRMKPAVTYTGMTRYWDEFTEYMMDAIDTGWTMKNLLGEVISNNGLRQLRIAETQKFRHVTSFFNGKITRPHKNEDQVDVPGRFDSSSFSSHPEMEAYNVTDELLKRLHENPYQFIAVNFANGDMVGHTGDMGATVRAIEVVDECQGRIVDRLLELDAHILITADHGNAEQMIDDETDMAKTSHGLNPVELIYLAGDSTGKRLAKRGKLSDIAPTVLYLLDLEIPREMTAQNLILTNDG